MRSLLHPDLKEPPICAFKVCTQPAAVLSAGAKRQACRFLHVWHISSSYLTHSLTASCAGHSELAATRVRPPGALTPATLSSTRMEHFDSYIQSALCSGRRHFAHTANKRHAPSPCAITSRTRFSTLSAPSAVAAAVDSSATVLCFKARRRPRPHCGQSSEASRRLPNRCQSAAYRLG